MLKRLLSSLVVAATLTNCGGNEAPPAERSPPQPSGAIVCSVFEPKVGVEGDSMSVSLQTDLPDYTRVMASVSRTYKASKDGSPMEDYSIDY